MVGEEQLAKSWIFATCTVALLTRMARLVVRVRAVLIAVQRIVGWCRELLVRLMGEVQRSVAPATFLRTHLAVHRSKLRVL